jgi:hypothetical protein
MPPGSFGNELNEHEFVVTPALAGLANTAARAVTHAVAVTATLNGLKNFIHTPCLRLNAAGPRSPLTFRSDPEPS